MIKLRNIWNFQGDCMESGVIQKEDDLILCIDPGVTKEKYFLLCESKQTYIKLEKNHYFIMERLFPLLDGHYEVQQIKQEMYSEGIGPIIVDKSLEFLGQKGLLKGSTVQTYSKVEIEMSSRKLLEFELENYFGRHSKFYKALYWVLVFITIALVMYGTVFGGFVYGLFLDSFRGADNFSWSQGKIFDIVIVCICFVISTFTHEMGHIISAISMGIKPKSFTLLLRMGVIPVFYIRYKDYYSTTSLKKIMISFGGIWINIVQMLICWILLKYYDHWVVAALLVYNAGICISCFTLFGTSDGYYIISTLFNLEGFRWNMLKTIGAVLYKKGSYKYHLKEIKNYIYVVYFIISYGLTFMSLYTIGIMIVSFINFDYVNSGIITMTVFVIIILNAIGPIRKLFRSLKKITQN